MPSIILSDNGVSSGSAGLKSVAASDGALALQTATAGGTATTAVYVDTSQNVGIGTTSPIQRLDVVSSNTDVFQAIRSTSSSPTNVALRLQDATTGTSNGDGAYLGRASSINYLWTYENEPWVFGTNSTERMRINAGAPILCLAGGNTSATGTGIAFPATQSASTDANTLDDYEEGTWTPTISGDGTNFSGTTYGATAGLYTKVGRTVWVSFDINVSTAGTLNTAGATISGLPFSIPNYGDLRNGGGGIGYITSIQSNYVYQSCYPQNSSAYLYIIGRTAASTSTIPPAANAFYANSIRITGYAWWNI